MNTTSNEKNANKVQISYILTFPEAQAHYVEVEMQISGLNQAGLDLKMPVWTPGSYMVREFSKNIESFTAETNDKIIQAVKTRKNVWHIETLGLSELAIRYKVYAFEISVRTSFIDASHAFLSSPDIFVYPDGMLDHPSTIYIKPYPTWTTVSTGLESLGSNQFILLSPDYDILFDSPIEVGTQEVITFDAAGVKHNIAMVGAGDYEAERLKQDFTKLIQEETAIFGENPNHHYTFIIHNGSAGGGGLEHLSSTVLMAKRDGYADAKGYQSFLLLAAHEYFHLWNVKRLRPFVLGPFDYDNENYTTALWIAEGFTSYYQDIVLKRAELCDEEGYLGLLAVNINTLENRPGAKVQTVAESSFDAWIKAYRPNENSANTTISYYNKGALIAMMLDLMIISNSNAAKSLDDVMRYMYDEYCKKLGRGFTDEEFKNCLEMISGESLDNFYNDYINGLTPIDYNQYLGYAGYKLVNELAEQIAPAIGITTNVTNGHIIISSVARNSAAWIAGLSVNDVITAINGKEIPNLDGILADKKPGDEMVFDITRDSLPMIITTTLLKSTRVKYRIESQTELNTEQFAVRKKWLKL